MGLMDKIEAKLGGGNKHEDQSKLEKSDKHSGHHGTTGTSDPIRNPVSSSEGYGSGTGAGGYGDSTSTSKYGGGSSNMPGTFDNSTSTGNYGSSNTSGTTGSNTHGGIKDKIPGMHSSNRDQVDRDGYGTTGTTGTTGTSGYGNDTSQRYDPYSSKGQRMAAAAGETGSGHGHHGQRGEDRDHGSRSNEYSDVDRSRTGGVMNSGPHSSLENRNAIPTAGGEKLGGLDGSSGYGSSHTPSSGQHHDGTSGKPSMMDKLNPMKDTSNTYDQSRSGTTGQGYNQPGGNTGSSGYGSSNQPSSGQHHYGRDAALAGGAGAGAYEMGRDKDLPSRPHGSDRYDESGTTGRSAHHSGETGKPSMMDKLNPMKDTSNTYDQSRSGTTGQSYEQPGNLGSSGYGSSNQPSSGQHHYGRDATGAGAAGVGAYELGKDRDHHSSRTHGSDRYDEPGSTGRSHDNNGKPSMMDKLNPMKDTSNTHDQSRSGATGQSGYGSSGQTSGQHHYGRDAAGTGAAGVGAYELGKDRDHSRAHGSDRYDEPGRSHGSDRYDESDRSHNNTGKPSMMDKLNPMKDTGGSHDYDQSRTGTHGYDTNSSRPAEGTQLPYREGTGHQGHHGHHGTSGNTYGSDRYDESSSTGRSHGSDRDRYDDPSSTSRSHHDNTGKPSMMDRLNPTKDTSNGRGYDQSSGMTGSSNDPSMGGQQGSGGAYEAGYKQALQHKEAGYKAAMAEFEGPK